MFSLECLKKLATVEIMLISIGIDPGLKGAIVALDETGRIIRHAYPVPKVDRSLYVVHTSPSRKVYKVHTSPSRKVKQVVDIKGIPLILSDILLYCEDAHVRAYIEQVGARPDQGTVSMFSFGRSTGALLGAAAALGIDTVEVLPQVWKKVLGNYAHDKDGAVAWATSIWGPSVLIPPRARTPHDGIADALGLAEWGRRHMPPERGLCPPAELAAQARAIEAAQPLPPPSRVRRPCRGAPPICTPDEF